ncbi:fluoride efflux transporter CrcB [Actinokineospora cianjurensis]|uniref:Fluoride-specific ion channel FluC n=1 Tax=Actinokineospora cianjurensis TaxID=585224 RepID=A0A421AUK1_9PSEU|nr:fluoride efflux transporter CrcB [Actinokineospora cianjurensis]RLK53769.1 camphor resistance protein CrcB [Actinokineospora cianjurensis]
MNGALQVAIGAAVGAPLRYLVDRAIPRPSRFPWGTLVVNVVGSLVLGVVIGLGTGQLLVGTGFCGALTTYSTFSYETLVLFDAGERRRALANIAVSVVVGLAAFWGGLAGAHAITG